MLIAESLIKVTSATIEQKQSFNLAIECPFNDNRLEARIDSLMDESDRVTLNWWQIIWLVLIFIPYSFLPFHIPC